MTNECPPALISEALQIAEADTERGLDQVVSLLALYGEDARLHFLKGSLMAALKRYEEAMDAMSSALAKNPDYAVARFQLGFLQLTSGLSVDATTTWEPLQQLDADDPLRLFAGGLTHFARDEFEPAIALLNQGIDRNRDNPAMNADMRLLISEAAKAQPTAEAVDEPLNSTQMLLQQFNRPTRH